MVFSLLLSVHYYVFTSSHVRVIGLCQVAGIVFNIIFLGGLKVSYIESDMYCVSK
jgi:hypothetical protein